MELYLAFVAASVLLMLIPGPNVALIVVSALARPEWLVEIDATAMIPD